MRIFTLILGVSLACSACQQRQEQAKYMKIQVIDSLVTVDMIDSLLDRACVDGAEHCINVLLARDSNNCAVYYKRGRLRHLMDSLPEAKADMNRVIKLGCRKGDAYYSLCLYAKKEKKYDQALLYLDTSLAENPNDTMAIKQRGKIIKLKSEENANHL